MTEPKFVPKPSQIDFTNVRRAPVFNCVVKYNDKILLVHRSPFLRFHPGVWNGISGFLDEAHKTIVHKVKEELQEEIGIDQKNILSIREGEIVEQEDVKHNKTWIVHPILAEVNTDSISLDWEATEYKWIDPNEARQFQLLPGFDAVLKTFFP